VGVNNGVTLPSAKGKVTMDILAQSDLKKSSLPYFEIPSLAGLGWIKHGFLTRMGGVSTPPYDSLNLTGENGDRQEHVSRNKERIAAIFGFNPKHLILLNQMHQDNILVLREPHGTIPSLLEYDALITDYPNTFLGILTADCLPVFVVDQRKKVIAAIHAGRQGTALHITTKVLKNMEEEFGCSPDNLRIALGPSIGPCCYEIGEEVFLPEWEPYATSTRNGKKKVDLAKINIAHMEREGIKTEQISWITLCTCCHHNLFFSYRRERRTGRQLSFIGIVR